MWVSFSFVIMGYFPGLVTMSGGRCWLVRVVICLSFFFSSSKMGVMGRTWNETDRLALLEFKAKISDDPFGVMKLWNDSAPFCSWYGVKCDTRHHRVIELDMHSLKLGGSITSHIGNLSFLHILWLDDNNFIREIPQEIGRLRRLRVLSLRNNTLSGEIPLNLSSCLQLEVLRLSRNKLEGHIAPELGFLSKLQQFEASLNSLTGGLPISLGNLTSLETMYVAGNNLHGRVSGFFGSLSHLSELGLAENTFSGELPSSIFNLTSLELFDVGSNRLEGWLPSNIFLTLPNLHDLSVSQNQFDGPIPASLSNASNLQILQIGYNKFTGKVPSLEKLNALRGFIALVGELGGGAGAQDDLSFLCSLVNNTALDLLELSDNNFGGTLPRCITSLSPKLVSFTIYNNYITGSIPLGIDNLTNLQVLHFENNSLTGTIPSTIGKLKNLAILDLSYNYLSGSIPPSLGKLSELIIMNLLSNRLEGRIPVSLHNCTSLQVLGLGYNNLTGSIPPEVLTIPSLSLSLVLINNRLTGPLPEEVGKLTNLNMLDLSKNMLSGRIPESIGECASLQFFYMDANNFQGHIPSSLSSLKGLQELDLSANALSGQIPEYLASFNGLFLLNLSFNDLEGVVPKTGIFANASAVSLKGNNKLCGGMLEFHLPECSNSLERKQKKPSAKRKVTIAVVAGITGVALLILVLLLSIFAFRKKERKSQEEHAVSPSENLHLQFVSYGDLHRATNGFSDEMLVGNGSFGYVYKGFIGEGGQAVAVKVLNLNHLGASKSFLAECKALKNIRHRNLVKLLTVCSGVDYQGNEFKALVYEFMPNESLEDWLHPPILRENEPRKLDLLQRLSIAIDVASLLEYVHHQCGTPLVHCDIKPSNVLLDDDLCGHVSDFGLAKFLSESAIIGDSSHPSTSTGIRGTVGYAPPEYGLGSKVSTLGDVYSYGILLLEMFTGKRPTHEIFQQGLTLHLYAKMALSARVGEILDPLLQGGLENGEPVLNPRRSAKVMDSLVSIIEIGVACSLESPVERMDMRLVTTKLRVLRDNLLRGRH